ncbi:hypothetical protein EGR_05280 [Echinococcus granulosus]|uniref:Uncharacterized protein n=1 Tax=Echinococcus granulosus TaxID=6210 RepID=W6V1P7_ECHGR|nr:hypothetical protein EGR_05280 [Echinococcus granulosus]EUB59804.1 hypothetical protein EGR_05280 [Echinococcus granulosus]
MWEKCGTIRATFIIKMPDFFNPTTEFWVLRFCCDIHRLDSDMKSNFIVVQGRNFMGPNITIFYPPRSGLLAITPSVRMNYIQKLTVANPKNLAMPLLELPLPESPTTPLNFDEFVFLVMTLRESFTKPNSGISSQNSRRVPMLSAASQNTGTDEKQNFRHCIPNDRLNIWVQVFSWFPQPPPFIRSLSTISEETRHEIGAEVLLRSEVNQKSFEKRANFTACHGCNIPKNSKSYWYALSNGQPEKLTLS